MSNENYRKKVNSPFIIRKGASRQSVEYKAGVWVDMAQIWLVFIIFYRSIFFNERGEGSNSTLYDTKFCKDCGWSEKLQIRIKKHLSTWS